MDEGQTPEVSDRKGGDLRALHPSSPGISHAGSQHDCPHAAFCSSLVPACRVTNLPPGCRELPCSQECRGGGLRLGEGSGGRLLLLAFPSLGINMGFCLEPTPYSLDEFF